jgi:protoporphyrinogen oxidase
MTMATSENTNTLILGSGMAGYGAYHALSTAGVDTIVADKNSYPGGHTATFVDERGWTFDDGPHISFTEIPHVQKLLAENLEGEFETIKCYVDNYFEGHWVKHPAQINLHGLPTDLVVDCVKDFIDAERALNSENPPAINNYEDWLRASFGDTFATRFPMVYGKRYHTTDAANMSTDWLGPRLYTPDLDEVLRGAVAPSERDVHYVDHFRYPTHGGFAAYLQRFFDASDLRLDHTLVGVNPTERIARFADGTAIGYEQLVSSVPLPELIPMIDGAPADVVVASSALACTECVVVNVGVGRDDISPAQWRYFYDEDIFFVRLSFPHLLSPKTVPDGCGSVQAECYFSDKYRPLDRSPQDCIQPVIDDLVRTGILEESDEILFSEARPIKYANVIFDLERKAALETVHGYLRDVGITWCGRYGDWEYSWTDQAFVSGEQAAQALLA